MFGSQIIFMPQRRLVGGIMFYPCPYVRPSVRPNENFRQAFLRNRKWDWFETWQDSLAWCIVRCKRLLWLSDINFLFDGTLFTLNTAKYTEFFRQVFLRNRKWEWFETWQDGLVWCLIRCKQFSELSNFNFLFEGTCCRRGGIRVPWTHFFYFPENGKVGRQFIFLVYPLQDMARDFHILRFFLLTAFLIWRQWENKEHVI